MCMEDKIKRLKKQRIQAALEMAVLDQELAAINDDVKEMERVLEEERQNKSP